MAFASEIGIGSGASSSVAIDAPQLGEHVWHAFTADPTIDTVSREHRDRIAALVSTYLPRLDWTRARLLELGAYRHYSGHLLAFERGCEFVLSDIAAASLRDGRAQAEARGANGNATLVVSDFHDLPFTDRYFDVVFVVSSVHHTRYPEQVLREMLRVLRPGGILALENEPCARACCFHAFVTNREDSFTAWEAYLRQQGLLPTLSSPFWGARAEQLFGMVENDRIPLSLYMDVCGEQGRVIKRRLSLHGLKGDFERDLMRLRGREEALRASVRSALEAAVARAAHGFGDTERLLGYRLPTQCEIHSLAGRVANLLDRRPRFATEAWEAEMFGAALSAVVRKNGESPIDDPPLFRRSMLTEQDGLVREQHDAGSIAGRLGTQLLQDLHGSADGEAMAQWFPKSDWSWQIEQHGARSMVNLSAWARIAIPIRATRTLLLVRYYAHVADQAPFRVRIWGSGRLIDDQLIVISESRLVRAIVAAECAELTVETCDLREVRTDRTSQVRIGVFQLFDFA